MKIALVTPYDYPHPGGVTEHVRHLDRELRARGHETRIIAPSARAQAELEPHVIKVDGEVIPLQVNGSTARLGLSPLAYEQTRAILAREHFDVVHIHEPAAPLLSLTALVHSEAVTVGTFHALLEPGIVGGAVYPLAMLPVLEWLDGRIFVSEPLRQSVASFFPGESRVIPNGIDAGAFSAPDVRPLDGFDDGRPNILFVGRMEARKGFRHLARAYPYIKQAVPEARLLVAGAYSAGETARFERYARRFGLADMHFIGRLSEADLPRAYRTASVFCAPSTGSESFGIVLLEAMAAGAPVVASDITGYRSVLTHGAEGYLVEPGNERALAESITGLLRDPDMRRRMAECGQAKARRYDWGVVAPRVLDYYAELIAARSARPAASHGERLSRLAEALQKQGADIKFKNDQHIDFEPDGLHVRGSARLAVGGKEIFKVTLG